jgi:hypothetical protein
MQSKDMKKYILNLILIVVSLFLSRAAFYVLDDPEGPNLLIVVLLALVIFLVLRLIIKFLFRK